MLINETSNYGAVPIKNPDGKVRGTNAKQRISIKQNITTRTTQGPFISPEIKL